MYALNSRASSYSFGTSSEGTGGTSGRSELDGEESDEGVFGDDDRLRMVNVRCGQCQLCNVTTETTSAYVPASAEAHRSASCTNRSVQNFLSNTQSEVFMGPVFGYLPSDCFIQSQ
jgi:hypothetical protein